MPTAKPPLRRWTPMERISVILLADQIREQVDAELGRLLLMVADGDNDQLPAIYDRLLVIGRPELGDRLRGLMEGRA